MNVENKKRAYIIGGIVILLIGVFLIFYNNNNQKKEKGATEVLKDIVEQQKEFNRELELMRRTAEKLRNSY